MSDFVGFVLLNTSLRLKVGAGFSSLSHIDRCDFSTAEVTGGHNKATQLFHFDCIYIHFCFHNLSFYNYERGIEEIKYNYFVIICYRCRIQYVNEHAKFSTKVPCHAP